MLKLAKLIVGTLPASVEILGIPAPVVYRHWDELVREYHDVSALVKKLRAKGEKPVEAVKKATSTPNDSFIFRDRHTGPAN